MGERNPVAAKLRAVAVVWAIAFLILSIILGYGLATHDWRFVRYGFFWSLAVHPACAVSAYMETRAAWSGKDTGGLQAGIMLCIGIAVFALSYVI